jgi:hypothetical protein
MTDAPPISPPPLRKPEFTSIEKSPSSPICECTAITCRNNWLPSAARIPHVSYRLRLHEKTRRHTPNRMLAFSKTKELSNSKFGNSSSLLARECRPEDIIAGRDEMGKDGIRLNSWTLKPLHDMLLGNSFRDLHYGNDGVTGTPIVVYRGESKDMEGVWPSSTWLSMLVSLHISVSSKIIRLTVA